MRPVLGRIEYWLKQGVKASDTVHNLLISQGIIKGSKIKKKFKIKKKKFDSSSKEEKPTQEKKEEEKKEEEKISEKKEEENLDKKDKKE